MKSVDERVAAVQRRTRRLQRRRNDRVLAVVVCLMVLPLVGVAGSYATGNLVLPTAADSSLFGAASLLGSSAGGYVIVAVASFAIAVIATLFIVLRRGRQAGEGEFESKDAQDEEK